MAVDFRESKPQVCGPLTINVINWGFRDVFFKYYFYFKFIQNNNNLNMMMPRFQSELGWSVWGSLGWTKTADGLNWRMLDRLGWGRIVAMLTCWL